jgi:hypothetical protein
MLDGISYADLEMIYRRVLGCSFYFFLLVIPLSKQIWASKFNQHKCNVLGPVLPDKSPQPSYCFQSCMKNLLLGRRRPLMNCIRIRVVGSWPWVIIASLSRAMSEDADSSCVLVIVQIVGPWARGRNIANTEVTLRGTNFNCGTVSVAIGAIVLAWSWSAIIFFPVSSGSTDFNAWGIGSGISTR